MTPHFHSLRIADVRRETADAVSIGLEVPASLADAYRYVPGQHLTLRARVDGTELRRSYSICSGLDDGQLRIAIKQVEGGRFSRWAHAALRPGHAIDVMTPDGRFGGAPDASKTRHHVAFAAGSGITPILSLARSLLAREPHSRFTLVYGNRDVASVMFHEALEDLKDRYLARFMLVHVFSREPQEIALFSGRLDRDRVDTLLGTLVPAATIDVAYVCGPGGMIDAVCGALHAAGVPGWRVHVERFHAGQPDDSVAHPAPTAAAVLAPVSAGGAAGEAPVPASADADVRVTVIADGVRREVPLGNHGTVLEAGLAAGLDLPYSCKGGMCCTCRGKLLGGEVRMLRNFSLEPADVAAGFVLTCQAVPVSARVTVSYDERN